MKKVLKEAKALRILLLSVFLVSFFCNACFCGQPEPAGCCCEFSDG